MIDRTQLHKQFRKCYLGVPSLMACVAPTAVYFNSFHSVVSKRNSCIFVFSSLHALCVVLTKIIFIDHCRCYPYLEQQFTLSVSGIPKIEYALTISL